MHATTILFSFLLAIIPGYLISSKKNISIFERLIIGISINIIFGIIITIIYKLNKISIITYIITITIIVLIKNFNLIKKFNIKKILKQKTYTLAILLIIVISSLPVILIHTNYTKEINSLYPSPHIINSTEYRLPFHGDEWTHIAQTQYIKDNGKIALQNPYFNTNNTRKKLTGIFQSGFHIMLAEFFILSNSKILENYWILPFLANIIFGIIAHLIIINILKNKEKKFKKSILLATAICTLTYSIQANSINLIANWFLTPVNIGILIALANILFYLKNNKTPVIITLIALLTIYAPIAIVITTGYIINWLITTKLTKRNIIIIATSTIIIASIVFSKLYPEIFQTIIKYLIYRSEEYINTEIKYNIIKLIGLNIIAIIFGIKLITDCKNKKYKIFLIIPIITIINILLFQFTNTTILLRYQRNIFLLNSICSILIGLGIFKIITKINNNHNIRKIISITLGIIILINITYSTINYQKIKTKDILYHIIEIEDYSFLLNTKKVIGEKNTILTGTIPAMTIYPTINNYVLTIAGGNLDHGDKTIPNTFIKLNCTEKMKFITKRKIDYIWTSFTFDCPQAKIIYNENNNYIYKFTK